MSVVNLTTGQTIATRVTWCGTFLRRARGLMFRRPLAEDEAYVFVENRESVSGTVIHMLFVGFPIAVFWLDAEKQVVDKTLARPWRPYYAPSRPAQYFVECHADNLDKANVGDRLGLHGDRT